MFFKIENCKNPLTIRNWVCIAVVDAHVIKEIHQFNYS